MAVDFISTEQALIFTNRTRKSLYAKKVENRKIKGARNQVEWSVAALRDAFDIKRHYQAPKDTAIEEPQLNMEVMPEFIPDFKQQDKFESFVDILAERYTPARHDTMISTLVVIQVQRSFYIKALTENPLDAGAIKAFETSSRMEINILKQLKV